MSSDREQNPRLTKSDPLQALTEGTVQGVRQQLEIVRAPHPDDVAMPPRLEIDFAEPPECVVVDRRNFVRLSQSR